MLSSKSVNWLGIFLLWIQCSFFWNFFFPGLERFVGTVLVEGLCIGSKRKEVKCRRRNWWSWSFDCMMDQILVRSGTHQPQLWPCWKKESFPIGQKVRTSTSWWFVKLFHGIFFFFTLFDENFAWWSPINVYPPFSIYDCIFCKKDTTQELW